MRDFKPEALKPYSQTVQQAWTEHEAVEVSNPGDTREGYESSVLENVNQQDKSPLGGGK